MPPRVPRPPRAGATWPGRRYDHRWEQKVMHEIYGPDDYGTVAGDKQIASREAQDNIEMLHTLKRDMPKEYQAVKDYYTRSEWQQRNLDYSPNAEAKLWDALKKIDDVHLQRLPQRQIGPLTEIDDELARTDAYLTRMEGEENYGKIKRTQRATRVINAMKQALEGGYAPAIVAAPLARYAVSDQTKTTPRAAKKTTRKKK
jgi:hypothetical protein